MKVNPTLPHNQNFKGNLTNKALLKGLEVISEHPASFATSVSFLCAVGLRPLAISLTPKAKEENKKYLSANSISSGLIKLAIAETIALPIEYAIKKIDENPDIFLKKNTIKKLKENNKTITESKNYKFITQTIKSGTNLLSAIPKSYLTVALTPILAKAFINKEKNNNKKEISFGNNILSKGISKIIDNKKIQKFAKKNIEKAQDITRNLSILTDVLLASTYAIKTKKSKKIEEDKKSVLITNELLSTGICLTAGVGIDKIAKINSKKIIGNFIKQNKNDPKLLKYIEGINILRPTMIFALIYYGFLPVVTTHLSDKLTKPKSN